MVGESSGGRRGNGDGQADDRVDTASCEGCGDYTVDWPEYIKRYTKAMVSRGNSVEDSEDIATAAAVRICHHKFSCAADVERFMSIACRSEWVDLVRHRSRNGRPTLEPFDMDMQGNDDWRSVDSDIYVDQILSGLTPENREIFRMIADGADRSEISARLNVVVNTLNNKVFRARPAMKEILNESK